jgi:hypothetical protein
MTAELTHPQASTRPAAPARPYAPSWLDRLTAAIERLPLPAWLFYALLAVLLVLVNHALQWLDGTLPPGVFDWVRISDPLPLAYFLALTHYLNGVARHALDVFRPALDIDDEGFARLQFELTTLPAWLGWLALALGLLLGAVAVALPSNRASFGLHPGSSVLTVAFEVLVVSGGSGTAFYAVLFKTLRQLRQVSRLHRQATRLDHFQREPVYAFSALTARAGLGLFFFSLPALTEPRAPNDAPYVIGLTTLLVVVCTACFVIPLLGMHGRLVSEKSRQHAEINRRLTRLHARLHEQVDHDRLDRIGDLKDAVSALTTERDLVDKVSTWPWKPATLQGFASSVVLPILIYLVTRYLGLFIK